MKSVRKIRQQHADSDEKTHRVQLDFTPDAFNRLLQIKDRAGVKTHSEAVRNALRLYDWFLSQMDEGKKLQLVDGKEVRQVEVLWR